jgi:hypothetical protein
MVKNDLLWKRLYKQEFLSDIHYDKEIDFLLWCVRTDPNNIDIPTRRSDLLERIDWYNSFRRRVITENNWRHGYSNTEFFKLRNYKFRTRTYILSTSATGAPLRYERHDINKLQLYRMEFSAYPDLKRSGNKMQENNFYTTPKTMLCEIEKNILEHRALLYVGDHYMLMTFPVDSNGDYEPVAIFVRGHKEMLKIIDVPKKSRKLFVKGKWALLIGGIGMPNQFYHPFTSKIHGIIIYYISNAK